MIFLVNAENRSGFAADLATMHRQRKVIFVDRAGWNVPVTGVWEIDRYDRDDTVYLLAKDQLTGPVLASVRLLPTDRPHLMSELFPAACLAAIPRGPTVWEVSRLCVAPGLHGGRPHRLIWEMVCGVLETALLYGIEVVVFAVNRALLRLLLHCGWEARALGPRLGCGAEEVAAAAASITPAGLRAVRREHGIPIPATRLPALAPLPPPAHAALPSATGGARP